MEAVLPIIEVKTWFTPRRGIGLPFTDACQGLTSPHFDFRSLLENALALGKQNGWEYLEVRGASSNANLPVSATFYNHKLDLKQESGLLFNSFDASVRRAIRKAEKLGIQVVRAEGTNGMQEYYRLHCLTRQSHGVPPQPYSFFKAIHQHIIRRDLGNIFLAKQKGQIIAGAVFFHFGSKALYKFGASDSNYEHFRPNNLWMWRAIQHYSEAGCDELDFGRTSVANEGLRRYKQNWGTVESKSAYTRLKVSNGAFLIQKDNVNNWQTKLFRRCPIGIARLIGKILYRHAA